MRADFQYHLWGNVGELAFDRAGIAEADHVRVRGADLEVPAAITKDSLNSCSQDWYELHPDVRGAGMQLNF